MAESGGGERQAALGFEPRNIGFANQRLRPLGYAAFDVGTLYTAPPKFRQLKISQHCTGGRR
jgi:hypothetical protein